MLIRPSRRVVHSAIAEIQEAGMKRTLTYSLTLLLALFLLSPATLFSQVADNTSLVGTVTDPSGSVLSGAKVVGTNVNTKVTYSGTTNAQGYYSIPFVAPGTYNVSVEAPGFQRSVTNGVIVTINQAVRTDATLKVGSANTEVTVSANNPPLSTDDALLG